MPKYRVLQLISTLERAGAQSLLLDLCRNLDSRTFDVTIAYLRGEADILSSKDASLQVVDLSDDGRLSPFALPRVISLLRNHSLIHTHLVHASIVGLIAAKFARTGGVVYTRHHADPPRPRWDYRLESKLARSADAMIAVSEATLGDILRTGADPERVRVISNAIDVERFADTRASSSPQDWQTGDGPRIGTIARLEPQKSLGTLIEAFAIVLGSFPGATLEIVGEGRERKDLESLAERTGIEKRVRFLGSVPSEDIPTQLSRWDVFALTSVREPFGIVVAEAMAAGVPVAVSDVGGMREVVRNEVTGLTFTVDSPTEAPSNAACSILRLLNDRDLRSRLCSAALAEVRERFDMKVCAARHADLYRDLLLPDS